MEDKAFVEMFYIFALYSIFHSENKYLNFFNQ